MIDTKSTNSQGVIGIELIIRNSNLSNTDIKCVLIREVSSFQGANNTYLYEVGTRSSVLIREVPSIKGCPLRGIPLYST